MRRERQPPYVPINGQTGHGDNTMNQLIAIVGYENLATEPSGDPPTFTVRAQSDEVTLLQGDPTIVPKWVKYETTVTMTGPTTLRETGTMILGDNNNRLDIETLGDGFFLPSVKDGVMQGTVMWTVTQGHGRFASTTGVITGNFTHDLTAALGREFQVLNLFLA